MLAVVTGASSGIGYELAVELAKRGYDLIVASPGERLTTAAEKLRALGRHVNEATVDLATPDGVEEL
jgi:short-subunit dehydrogenase